jgi:hypothetical protein
MRITICGSVAYYEQMLKIKSRLENLDNDVKLPPMEVIGTEGRTISVVEFYNPQTPEAKNENKGALKKHFDFDNITWCEAILVVNADKKDVANYIDVNTLIEMGVAFYLDKPIYLLNPVPEISYKEEILAMFPMVVNDDLTKI